MCGFFIFRETTYEGARLARKASACLVDFCGSPALTPPLLLLGSGGEQCLGGGCAGSPTRAWPPFCICLFHFCPCLLGPPVFVGSRLSVLTGARVCGVSSTVLTNKSWGKGSRQINPWTGENQAVSSVRTSRKINETRKRERKWSDCNVSDLANPPPQNTTTTVIKHKNTSADQHPRPPGWK